MSRYAKTNPGDTLQSRAGDGVFVGVDMRTAPELLGAGYVQAAMNKRFRSGRARKREGSYVPPWGIVAEVLATRGIEVPPEERLIVGDGVFSDPQGVEWLVLVTPYGVVLLRDGHSPRLVAIPGDELGQSVEVVPAFRTVLLFRTGADGRGLVPWKWDGVSKAGFVAISQADTGDGTRPIPSGLTGELYSNRILVPFDRDSVAISDALSYTRYDPFWAAFRITSGTDDRLVRLLPHLNGQVLCFKDQSLQVLRNVSGDLSGMRLDQVSRTVGLVGRKALAMVGGDVIWLSQSGVYSLSQVADETLKASATALSEPIAPLLERITWRAAHRAVAVVHGDYWYLAVPLDGHERPNAILPYNTLTQTWEGLHQWPEGVAFDALQVTDWNDVRRLYGVDYAAGRVHLLYEGRADLIGPERHEIADVIHTRAYLLEDNGITAVRRCQVTLETWGPRFTVEFLDGACNGVQTLALDRTKSRTRARRFGSAPIDPTNRNRDHAAPGREDYSMDFSAPVWMESPIAFDQEQGQIERYPVRGRGRAVSLRISSSAGTCTLGSVELEGDPILRATRSS